MKSDTLDKPAMLILLLCVLAVILFGCAPADAADTTPPPSERSLLQQTILMQQLAIDIQDSTIKTMQTQIREMTQIEAIRDSMRTLTCYDGART